MKLNSGGMEDFSRHLGVNRILAVIYCSIYIFLQADGNSISQTAGSKVTLNCSNESLNCLIQLTWSRNEERLFSFLQQKTSNSSSVTLNRSQKASGNNYREPSAATNLKLNMSTSESELYALIIESAWKNHTGNYTCDTTTDTGVFQQKWELIITEPDEAPDLRKSHITAAIIVPCICFLIFVITALIILRQVCKQRSQNITQPPRRLQQQQEPVYENLEFESLQRSVKIQVHPYKYRADCD